MQARALESPIWCKLKLQRARFGANSSFHVFLGKILRPIRQGIVGLWLMWSWVKWCNNGNGRGLWRRGPGGLAAAGEAWPSLSLSLIWWSVGVRLWILEFGLLVIGGFLILVCWRGGGDFAMDFGFWFCYGFWVLILPWIFSLILLWILLWILAKWRD